MSERASRQAGSAIDAGRDQQPGERGAAGPQRGGERGGAEAGGSERRRADDQRRRQADGHAGAAAERGFAERDADELAGGGAAGAQQRGVAAPAIRARRGDRGGHQAGEDRAGDAEEQEQQLGVEGVLAGAVERGAEVVADQAAAGELRLEVARVARDPRERGIGAGGQPVRELRMDLRRDLRAALEAVEGALGQQDDVVGRRLGLGADRRADLLEQRVDARQVDDAVDLDRGGRAAGAADA